MTASIVQIVLLLAMVDLITYFVANRRRARAKAGVKLGFVVFVIACLRTIVRSSDLTVMVDWIDMTRGTDLLFYVPVLAFMFITVSSYIRSRKQELRYAQLTRTVTLKTTVHPEEEVVISGSQNSNQKDSSTNVEKNAPSGQSAR